MAGQRLPALGGITETEPAGDLAVVAAVTEIAARRSSIGGLEKNLVIEVAGHLVDARQTIGFDSLFFFRGREGLLGDLDPDPFAELPGRLGKGEPLHFHHEGEDVPPDAAAEAVKDLPRRVDIEGRGLLAVKGAEPQVVGPRPFEGEVGGDDLDDVGALPDVLNFLFRYPSAHYSLNSTMVTLSPPRERSAP